MTSICLNMIVKNEAPRIERCLASVVDQISSWVILDTGSTDDTVERIIGFFEMRKMPGALGKTTFRDFSTTRNEALGKARDAECEYILLIDADMELSGSIPDALARFSTSEFFTRSPLAPSYLMMQRTGGLEYWNTRLVRRDLDCRYVGVTHEYLDTGPYPNKLHGPHFIDHADGGNRPGKVQRDIDMLHADVQQGARSWFYLGQSFKEAGKLRDAIHAYETRFWLGGWQEELFVSKLAAARCAKEIK